MMRKNLKTEMIEDLTQRKKHSHEFLHSLSLSEKKRQAHRIAETMLSNAETARTKRRTRNSRKMTKMARGAL